MTTLVNEELTKIEKDECSLVVVVFDMNPKQKQYMEDPAHLSICLESAIAFGNCHLMQNHFNKLAIIGSYLKTCKYLYINENNASTKLEKNDGQFELFSIVEKTVKDNFKKYSSYLQTSDESECESQIAGSIAMALCYIMKVKKENPINTNLNSRILVISGARNSANCYMDYMNLFFTSQKLNVVLDVCSLDHDLNLLQQGCDITSGIYLKIPQTTALLQYLMWVFLPDQQMRQKLNLPPSSRIDYRAACFCHKQLIDIGFVCSVCLSVFCKYSPICTTCHAIFSTVPSANMAKRRKI